MKKINLLLSMALISAPFMAGAQSVNSNVGPVKKGVAFDKIQKVDDNNLLGQTRNTVWANDFSTPADWAITNASTPTPIEWEITTDVNASPYAALNPINLATANNGFAFIDADAGGNGSTQDSDITLVNSVDLSLYSDVVLSFYQVTRNYATTYTVRVSGDNGATWTDFIVNGNLSSGTNSDNPEQVKVDITSVAGGQPNVLIEFNYQANWGWFWAVDDVEIIEKPDNDLVITEELWGCMGTWSLMPYYMLPQIQLTDVIFNAKVENAGALDQTNTTLSVDINAGATTSSSAAVTIPSAGTDSLFVDPAFAPTANGTYAFDVNLESDAVDDFPADNMYSGEFEVNDFIMARDMGTPTGGMFNSGNGYEGGNVFDIFSDATVYDIVFRPDESSETTGQILISAILYEIDLTTGDFNFVEASADYFLDPSEFGTIITLPLENPVNLLAGSVYLAVVKTFGNGGSSNDLVISTAGQSEAQTTFIYLDDQADWFYSTSTPMVRLSFDGPQENSIDEESQAFSVGNFPNPFNETTTISYNTSESGVVNVNVKDLSGKEVFSKNYGSQNPGEHTINFDGSSLAEGVYTYTISINEKSVTKKMMIAR